VSPNTEPDDPSSERATIRVLHVDDEPGFVEMAAEFLEREDDRFEVTTETSVAAALERLESDAFDCVVSDYDMPGRNGVEFLEAVHGRDPDLPFVLFTGKGSEEVASEAISAGVTDYLQKEGGTEQYAILANRLTNVVERVRSRRALAERKRRLETLIGNLPGIVYRCRNEPDWPMEIVEGECRELTGYSAAALENDEVVWGEDVIHPDDRESMWEAVQSALDAGESFEVTYRIETADGETRWMWERGSGVYADGRDGTAELEALEGFITDVTAQREREAELERTNALRSTLFDALPVGVLAEDDSREVMAANRQLVELFDAGSTPEEFVGRDCAELAAEISELFAEPERFRERIDELVEERLPADEELALADGRTFKRIHRPIEFDDGDGHLWVYQDVTDRVAYETDLQQFETILETSGDPVYALDAEGRFTYVNDSLVEMVGYPAADLLGEHASIVLQDGDVERMESVIESLLSTGERRETTEIDVVTPDGETIPCELHLSILPSDGSFQGTVGIVRDISERIERDRKLDRLRDRTQALMYTESRAETAEVATTAADDIIGAPLSAVHLLNESGDVIEPCATVESVTEYFEEAPEYPCDAPEGTAASLIWEVFESGEPLRIDDTDAYGRLREERPAKSVILHPIGRHGVFIVSSGEPNDFDDTEETLVELLATSLRTALDRVERETELRRQRNELRERNERLDQFASVVSHDLRNPLNVASGHLELAREEFDTTHLDAVANAHERMISLVDDLLTIAREGDEATELQPVDLAELATGCWEGVETAGATLEAPDEHRIRADPGRARQLLENLFRNAVEHGRADGGTHDEADPDRLTVRVGTLDDGFYVEDDGVGIRPEGRERLFEVGYSTSQDGTGFGLAIVEQVADAHGWDVSVTEGSDGGARFEIRNVDAA
jgi:PAS domain S-box-containing protein